MVYHFMHYFDHNYGYRGYVFMTDEKKIEIARQHAIEDLAKELVKMAEFKVNQFGNVEGTLVIPE